MADKRMIYRPIVDSDEFLEMPSSAQNLYFHLNLKADDEGFIDAPKGVARGIGASQEDLNILLDKRYILGFKGSSVMVVKHWKLHNSIRKDRLKETLYTEEKASLFEKENGAYTDHPEPESEVEITRGFEDEEQECDNGKEPTPRQLAYRESSLPSTFNYRIRNAFYGIKCPICGSEMVQDKFGTSTRIPTIQHNTPISKGGKHEIGNISVICRQCNVSIKDKKTGILNSLMVKEIWATLTSDWQVSDKRQTPAGQVTDRCRHRLDKSRLDKIRLGIINSAREAETGPLSALIWAWNKFPNLPEFKYPATAAPNASEMASRIKIFGLDEILTAMAYLSLYWGEVEPQYRPASMDRFVCRSLDVWLDSAKPWERYEKQGEPDDDGPGLDLVEA